MGILELSVRADSEGAEALAAAFSEYAYGGAVIEQTVTPEPGEIIDPARPYTVRAFLLLDDSVDAKRQALERVVWTLGLLRPVGELQERVLEEADWANAWKKFYSVMHIGEHFVIKPSWLDYSPTPGDHVVELDPGMAFGTGLHPSTRLCLAALERYVHPGDKVLDVGTGSGILAIGAARLGASSVDARDTDPIATEAARKNVEINNVRDCVRVADGSITLAEPSARAAVVVANILAEVIAALSPVLAYHLAPGGTLIASGILADRAGLVVEAFQAEGLIVVETTFEQDWLAIAARK